MLLSDNQIRKYVKKNDMISPFIERQTNGISSGLSSYGYDIRVSDNFLVCKHDDHKYIDPKNFDKSVLKNENGNLLLPAHGFALGHSVEYLKIPKNIIVICMGKSTYARCGLIVHVTPLEPGWEGQVTLEFSNTTSLPVKIYANEGICQLMFFECDPCEIAYNDRNGKYMKQLGITLPKTR